jgi:2',3'-cyclic-nucleotide 2'-phosphodiesterase (5'-nucleotidase family)
MALRWIVAAVWLLWAGAAAAEQVRITFLHVNDIYEYRPIDGQGGLAELATRLDQERARLPNPVFTFGGDLLSPSLASNLTKGAHMVAFFNAMEPLAAVPGNHEFDISAANFAERIKESRFPWVVSNLVGPDGSPFGGMVGTKMAEVGGIKLGIFGLLTKDSEKVANTKGLAFVGEFEAARMAVKSLRDAGAQLVVALTHLDLDQDRRLAGAVKGIDLILGGHDHDPVSIQEDGPLILKAGHDAYWLGEVEMMVETSDSGAVKVATEGWRFVKVAGAAPRPDLVALADATDARLGLALEQPLARLATSLDSRTTAVRGGEAAIGNLFADALRDHFQADLALLNGGGLRGNRQYQPGTRMTRRDVLAEMPFGNAVMALDITGAQLRDALEHALSGVEAKAGRFPQLSGLVVRFDPAKPAGKRLVSVTVGGKALNPKHTYRLATTDYLAHGGDGFNVLKGAKVVVDASGGPLLANVVGDYLAAKDEVAPMVEGRVQPVR